MRDARALIAAEDRTPLPGPLSPPQTTEGAPWVFFHLATTFLKGIGYAELDENEKPIAGSAPRVNIDKIQAEIWFRLMLSRGWENPAAAFSLATMLEDKVPNEALQLYEFVAGVCEEYKGDICVQDFEDDHGRQARDLDKRLKRVKRKLDGAAEKAKKPESDGRKRKARRKTAPAGLGAKKSASENEVESDDEESVTSEPVRKKKKVDGKEKRLSVPLSRSESANAESKLKFSVASDSEDYAEDIREEVGL